MPAINMPGMFASMPAYMHGRVAGKTGTRAACQHAFRPFLLRLLWPPCSALPCPVVACRSGGHSYQGYSVIAGAVTIDLILLNSTTVAADQQTALVQAGSRLGQLYYNVYNQTNGAQGAVGGTCPTVGTGGHFLGARQGWRQGWG